MKLNHLAIVASAALGFGGCASPQPYHTVFQAEEFAPYGRKGTASVAGQVFGKTLGGDVKLGAGNLVFLCPATSYYMEWYRRSLVGPEIMQQTDPRASRFERKTVADAQGNFRFVEIPQGRYILMSRIDWMTSGGNMTGGVVFRIIDVGANQSLNVLLNR